MLDAFTMPGIEDMHQPIARLDHCGIGELFAVLLLSVIENEGGFPGAPVLAQGYV